jgi:hypothetical protein
VTLYSALLSLENVSLPVPTRSLRGFLMFNVCRSNAHCPAWCGYAANAMGKDLDISVNGAVSLDHIL